MNNEPSSSSSSSPGKDDPVTVDAPPPPASSIDIKPSSTTTTTTTFSITNPMHSTKQQPESPSAADGTSNSNRCPCRCQPRNTIKGILLFILSSIAIGFVYIASQAVASATAEKKQRVEVRWWFKVDGIELMFYLFVLSAVLHFAINAGGGSKIKIKYWPTFVPLILAISCILIGVAPDVYQQANHDLESVKYERRGCQLLDQVDQKFGLLNAYPAIKIKPNLFLSSAHNSSAEHSAPWPISQPQFLDKTCLF